MKYKSPYIARLNEVIITRDGEIAVIAYKERDIMTTNLKIDGNLQDMSDQDILDCHNHCIEVQLESIKNYKHLAVEIPPGKPQTEYFEAGGYWTPRGDVLRCHIEDGGECGETTICIDDKEFTMREFGRLLSTYTGWGMRITMVPEDELHVTPAIEIKDPDDDSSGSIALAAELAPINEH